MGSNVNNFMKSNHRIANTLISIIVFGFAVACVFLYDSNNILLGYVLPIAIAAILVISASLFVDYLFYRYYKYSWVRSLDKLRRKKKDEEPESYNLYPVDPKLLEKGLSSEQNEILIRYRIVNFFLYCITDFVSVYYLFKFDSSIERFILEAIMVSGAIGVLFVTFDLIAEAMIKIHYKKTNNQPKVKRMMSETRIYKNNGIYYIPICLFIGIIVLVGILDFDKKLSYNLTVIGVVCAITLLVIVIIWIIVSRIIKTIKIIDKSVSISDKE